jgi:hypothetical protein
VNYFEYTLADHAIPYNTPWHEPQGTMVVPGEYEVRLIADGKTLRRKIAVTLDPRIPYSTADLRKQFDLAQKIATGMSATYRGYNQVADLRKELASRIESLKKLPSAADATAAASDLDKKTEALADAAGPPAALGPMNRDLTRLMIAVDQSDSPPASSLYDAFAGMCADSKSAMGGWHSLVNKEIPELNAKLAALSLVPLPVPKSLGDLDCN